MPVIAVELQQTLSGGSGGRGQGEGSLHVDRSLTQPPLNAVRLIQLLHLQETETMTESKSCLNSAYIDEMYSSSS